jgi:hypothetical protein
VKVDMKIVNRLVHKISTVPRVLGWPTQPSMRVALDRKTEESLRQDIKETKKSNDHSHRE